MPLDHYVTLGRSGLRVSPLCLGTMTFEKTSGGGVASRTPKPSSTRWTSSLGTENFIDTANFYTKGHSEKIIGDHLAHDREKRDRLVIATKFSGNMYVGDPNGGGSNRKSILERVRALCFAGSARTTSTSTGCITGDKFTPIEETMSALNDLVQSRQGALRRRIRHPRVEGGAGAAHRPVPRVGAVHRAADRVLAPGAHRRRRAHSDGGGARARCDSVVAAEERRVERQVHAKECCDDPKPDGRQVGYPATSTTRRSP